MVRPDGKFSISGLTPGEYVLRVGGSMNGDGETAIQSITVGDSDLTDVQLITARPSSVSGRVVFGGQVPPPNPSALRVSAVPADPMGRSGILAGDADAGDDVCAARRRNEDARP